MRRFIAVVAFLAFAFSLTGCQISWQTIRLSRAPRAMTPRPAKAVRVFMAGRPSTPYHEVLLIQSAEDSATALYSDAELLHDLRSRAGELGCDGLIMLALTDDMTPRHWRRPRAMGRLRTLRATCIVYDAKMAASGP